MPLVYWMKRMRAVNNFKSNRPHVAVMVNEVLKGFHGLSITTFFEGTLGAGGHAAEILTAHPEIRRYIACDLDQDALELAEEI